MARLTERTSKLDEDEALRRLSGLFVGKTNHEQSCAVVTLTDEGKRDYATRSTSCTSYARRNWPCRASASKWADRRSTTWRSASRASEH